MPELNLLRDLMLHQLWSLLKRFREIRSMNNLYLLGMRGLQPLSNENLKLFLLLGIFFSTCQLSKCFVDVKRFMLFYPFVYSILQKASTALEVLKEVLDAVDSQNPEVYDLPFDFVYLPPLNRHSLAPFSIS